MLHIHLLQQSPRSSRSKKCLFSDKNYGLIWCIWLNQTGAKISISENLACFASLYPLIWEIEAPFWSLWLSNFLKVDHENRIYSWTEIPQQQLKNCFSNIFGSCSRVFLSATIFSFRTKIYFHWFWYMYMFFLDKRLSLLILKLYMYIDFICKCVFDSSKASNYSWLKFHFF